MADDCAYVLGTDEAELERLGFQHRLWARAAWELWDRLGVRPGQVVLDLGCGPGFASRDLAQLLGRSGRVIAFDESARYLDVVRARGSAPGGAAIEAVRGDAQALDVGEGVVDSVFARWVLSFTPEPERAVEGVARALKVGGRFAVQDYVLWRSLHWGPRNETVEVLRRGILGLYESVGADSQVGQRVPAMMESAGLRVLDVYPITAIARPGTALWQWPMTFFEVFLPKVVTAGFLTDGERGAIMDELRALERTPGAFFWTPPMVGVVGEKL